MTRIKIHFKNLDDAVCAAWNRYTASKICFKSINNPFKLKSINPIKNIISEEHQPALKIGLILIDPIFL